MPSLSDKTTEENPATVLQSSPKISDQLRKISNSLKLLNSMAPSIVKQKTDIVRPQSFDLVEAEPKTPEVNLKLWHAQDAQESLKARSTGIKVTILNSLHTLFIVSLALVINCLLFFSTNAEISS